MAAVSVLKEAGTQTLGTYIDKRQEAVAEWVMLRPMLEVCDRETRYEGGGRCRDPWWRKMAAQKQLSVTLEEISAAARERCWESDRRGKCGGGGEVEDYDSGREVAWYSGTDTGDAWVGE